MFFFVKNYSKVFITPIFLFFVFVFIGQLKIDAATSSSNVLMLGATLNDLAFEDKQRFSKYNVLERAYTSGDNVMDLVRQSNPIAVVIRQPSGGIYEYSPNGSLIKQLSMKSEMQKMMESQQFSNLPTEINPQPMGGSSMLPPPMTSSPMPPCSTCSAAPIGPYKRMPMFGPYDVKWTYRAPSKPLPYDPLFPPTPVSQTQMPIGQFPQQAPPKLLMASAYPQTMQPNLVPPPSFISQSSPFPGANVPSYMFPGKSEYSYLPGEGDVDPPPGIGIARQSIKRLANLANQNAYPFWFDNFLQTDSNATQFLGNNIGGAAAGTNAGFPPLNFTADTTGNAAVVGGQFAQTGIGIGAQLVDAFLDGRQIEARRAAARADAAGTPYYYYPNTANTYYPSTPYQPIPNRSFY